MRILPIALVLAAGHAHAAILPVFTTPQPNTKQLSLVNFGAFGGATVGVNHVSSIADDPPAFTYQPVDSADFWLINFAGYICVDLVGDPPGYIREPLPLLLPEWAALGAPLTVTLLSWSLDEPRRLLTINIEAKDGVRTLIDGYTVRVKPVPEPSALLILAAASILFCAIRPGRSNPVTQGKHDEFIRQQPR